MFKRIEFLFWILVALFILIPILNTVIQNWVSANGTLAQEFNATDPHSRYAVEREYTVAAVNSDSAVVYNDGAGWFMIPAGTDPAIYVGYFDATHRYNGGGMRFQSIYFPSNTIIGTAHLVLTARFSHADVLVNSVITGEKVLDATTFSTLANYQGRRGTVVGGANNVNITTANVTWDNIPAWTQPIEYESPDIAPIIQEIVNQNGWVSGNDIVLFWDDHGNRSTNVNGRLRAASVPTASPMQYSPQLHISYLTDNIALTPLETAVTQFYVLMFVIFFAVILLYVLSKGGNSGGGGGAYN
jgi:hypothetical protein